MTTISQSTNNDIALTQDGQIALASGKEAYRTVIEDTIRTLRGELQLDLTRGIRYEETIWTNRKLVGEWMRDIRKAVRALPFVVSIISLDTKQVGGVLEFEIAVETDLGAVRVASEIPAAA